MVSTAPRSSARRLPDTEADRATHRRPGHHPLPGQPVRRARRRSAAKFFAGCFGIFGHGNVAGLGQALLQEEIAAAGSGPSRHCRTCSAATSRPWCTPPSPTPGRRIGCRPGRSPPASGPGSTNMLTGAALATINRLPVLLLPADTFATRVSSPVLQELELPTSGDVTVNDAFKPLSRYFDRVWRPEQLPAALLGAMRVLTDPVETGAATVSHPPGRAGRGPRLAGIAVRRTHLAYRPAAARAFGDQPARPRSSARARQPADRRRRRCASTPRPTDALAAFCEQTGIPVGRDPGRQGFAALRPPADPSARSARPARPPPTRWPPTPMW